ncbi:hypothetical protein PGTUg99_014261 [Puccinia graminis f. sp. tritici]|uniref:Uncharacterized protein n=1 Tax=Puccinia graminis f. sp. tritici TaxID=56615 RepID=A0A5B0RUH7_PUCGR|nr:hypothetical protein PGTUg99_014261 [Puccinia graminis f. sp. tritici]
MRQAQYGLNVLGVQLQASSHIDSDLRPLNTRPARPVGTSLASSSCRRPSSHMYSHVRRGTPDGVLSATIRIHPFDLRLGPAVVILCSYLGYRTLLNASINQPSAKHAHAQSDVQPASLELHQVLRVLC